MTTETEKAIAKLRFEIAKKQTEDILYNMRHVPDCDFDEENALFVHTKAKQLLEEINNRLEKFN